MINITLRHFMSHHFNSQCITKLQEQLCMLEAQCEEAESRKPPLLSLYCTFFPCFLPFYWPKSPQSNNSLPTDLEFAMTWTSCNSSKSLRNCEIRMGQGHVLSDGKNIFCPLRKSEYHGLWNYLQMKSLLKLWEQEKGRGSNGKGGQGTGFPIQPLFMPRHFFTFLRGQNPADSMGHTKLSMWQRVARQVPRSSKNGEEGEHWECFPFVLPLCCKMRVGKVFSCAGSPC